MNVQVAAIHRCFTFVLNNLQGCFNKIFEENILIDGYLFIFDTKQTKSMMMLRYILSAITLCFAQSFMAQVGIGTVSPNAALEVVSTNSGLLIPRVQLTALTVAAPVTNPQTGALVNGTLVYNLGPVAPGNLAAGFYYWNATTWVALASSMGNTLDQAYDQGGAGAGRIITVDAGAVTLNNGVEASKAFEVNNTAGNTVGIDVNQQNTGVGVRVRNTYTGNTFSAIQSETNASSLTASAILGMTSGLANGLAGQASATSGAQQAVLGNHLSTTGGSGVQGNGFRGVSGVSNAANAAAAGVYAIGYNGSYSVSSSPTLGYAVYCANDIYIGAGVYGPSDLRYKSNIVPLTGAVAKLHTLSSNHYTIDYTIKNTNGEGKIEEVKHHRQEYGLIAQEVEKVFPNMIKETVIDHTNEAAATLKAVNYIQLVPVLVEAVRELKAEIDQLKAALKMLEKQ
jgi:hypothetical protein